MKIIPEKLRTYFTRYPRSSRLGLFLIGLTLVFVILRIILTPTIIHLTDSWLKDQGIDASIEDIRLNIIDGTVTLTNAKGTIQGKTVYEIGRVHLHLSWSPLSEKIVKIVAFDINHLSIHIKNYSDNIIIGGLQIPLSSNAEEIASAEIIDDGEIEPWAASLGKVVLTDLNICYLQHSAPLSQADKTNLVTDHCVTLEEMKWTGDISYAVDSELYKSPDLSVSTSGDFVLKGLAITDNKLNKILLSSKSNTLSTVKTRGLNSIELASITMQGLSIMQRNEDKHKDALRFDSMRFDRITLQDLNHLAIDGFELKSPGLYIVKEKNKTWEYQQWLHGTTATPTKPENKPQDKSADTSTASAFKFTIKNINIDDADFCHLDKETALYYCYTHESLSWSGPINYDESKNTQPPITLDGDLKLKQPAISNFTINRNLATIDAINLTKLNINGQNVKLANLDIIKLAALQRGKKTDDNTIEFDSLKIKAIDYKTNAVSIKSINLDGIKQLVSKNKDGSWEFDKWLPKSDATRKQATEKQKKTTETKKSTTKKSPEKKTGKPFAFALGKISINTNKPQMYIDNTTVPPLKGAFTSMTFSLAGLDSTKPEHDSPLTLHAKTSRYATIDIEGTVRPLAEKISFDAKGNIKGMDLRALTPLTKKTIGHIISNGQLDAELNLLAKEGILDSDIDFTLYKFEITPINKKDAKELDAELGLPLNQTLSLLRDKKNNIHLSVPITGDLENPSFDPMDAIITATSGAATSTLITYFTPYGLIYAGGNLAFDLATALHFDPILFKTGSSKLDKTAKEKLDELTELLEEKPQVHLTLCGVTNKKDSFVLFPDLKKKYEANKEEAVTLSKAQSAALEKLARERQINSKKYLVEQHKIAHGRLILCVPEHKIDDDEISGVEVNI
jgi:hypothetical protein